MENHDIISIIELIANDPNSPIVGGCAECAGYLQGKYGFTDNQQAEIETRIYRLANYIRKNGKK